MTCEVSMRTDEDRRCGQPYTGHGITLTNTTTGEELRLRLCDEHYADQLAAFHPDIPPPLHYGAIYVRPYTVFALCATCGSRVFATDPEEPRASAWHAYVDHHREAHAGP